MNENSYLNPTNIQEESNSAISKLEKDNEDRYDEAINNK